MLRNVLTFGLALVASFGVISLVQYISHWVYPPPQGLDLQNPEHLAQFVAGLPLGAFWMLEASYLMGSLAGGGVIGRFATRQPTRLALGLGALLTVFNVLNLASIPHPLWVAVLTTLTFLPGSFYGAKIATQGREASPQDAC